MYLLYSHTSIYPINLFVLFIRPKKVGERVEKKKCLGLSLPVQKT